MSSRKTEKTLSHQFELNDPLHKLFDAISVISVQGYDEERKVIYWNKGSETLYGYSKQEATGQKLEDLIIPPAMREGVIQAHGNWLKQGVEIPAAEISLLHKSGTEIAVFSSHVMFTNQYGTKQMYCIDIDLTDVRKAQAQALFKEHMLETIFDAIPDLFFLMKKDGTIIDYHANKLENLYVSPQHFIGKNMADVMPEEVSKKFQTYFAKVVNQTELISFEYDLMMPQGTTYYEARIAYLTKYDQIIVIIRDITAQHKSAELIRHQAYYDSLTLLPNRFLALDRLSQILIEAKRNHQKAVVIFLDLDDFKKVNDSLGHEVGDKLLIKAANRLKQVVRKEDTVGRLGGDEFIVLLKGLTEQNDALVIAENLLKIFRKPFKLAGRELTLTLSIGVAVYPENGNCASDLLRNADTAMYQAKALGRNTFSFFTSDMNRVMQRRFEIEEQMHTALERGEFEVFYQPKFEVNNNSIVGAEALLRWKNTLLGNVTPDEFIPIAENTGLIVPIGEFVIQQALQLLKRWQTAEQQAFTMAINLSPRQFRDRQLLSKVQQALDATQINPRCLEFEITEGVLMDGQAHIHESLAQISALGITLSQDDFGTGYSSLSYLRQFPFNVLKIDRSFIHGITLNKSDCDLVTATIAMANSLGLTVVAEGVETAQQLTILKGLGCDLVQGFYFSKPLPANQLLEFSSQQ